MKPDLYKVVWIGDGFLAVMAKPIAGEWIDDELRAIAKEGIIKIVSLLGRHEAFEVGLEQENEYAQKNAMEFVSYPIQDRGLPSSVKEFSHFTHHLYHDIATGKNTVIHCRAGIGRTGLVAAGVLLHHGFKPDEAFKHISQKRGVQVPDTEEQYKWIVSNHHLIIKGG